MPRLVQATPPPPTVTTLRRYGITADDWAAMCRRQLNTCPVCRQPFGDRQLVIDHAHVAGFKARKRRASKKRKLRVCDDGKVRRVAVGRVRVRVMSQDERRVHVRGVLHAYCNGLVRRWLTLERAESIVDYLRAHAARAGVG